MYIYIYIHFFMYLLDFFGYLYIIFFKTRVCLKTTRTPKIVIW